MGGYRNIRIGLAVLGVGLGALPGVAQAALNIPLTVNMSEAVTVDTTGGTPRIAVDVGGNTRYATYTSGSGTSALTFTLTPTVGDVDLDGITVSSPINLNGGTIKDAVGNNATLTFTLPNTSGIKVDYPSLSMDFANSDYILSGTHYATLPGLLTAAGGSFTRASIGTYYDSSGVLQTASSGTPRFDYDPVTHTTKGILIEESRVNQTLYGKDFDNADWTPGSFITPNVGVAPDGTMTADLLTQANNSSDYVRDQNILATQNTTYTFSIFFKPGTRTTDFAVMMDWADYGSLRALVIYTYGSKTVWTGGSGAARINDSSVQELSNGWFRLNLTFTTDTNVGHIVSMIGRYGSGIGTTYIWGAQLEQGTFATSYIPTTSAAVTRAGDQLVVQTSGWLGSGDETMFAQAEAKLPQPSWASLFVPNQSYPGQRYLLLGGTGTVTGGYNGTNVTTANQATSNTLFRAGAAFGGTATAASLNGTLTTGSSFGRGSPTTVSIGYGQGQYLNGRVSRVKYYPSAVTNTQLQLMTQ